MSMKTSAARLASRYLRAMRALSPAAIALTVGLVLGGAGLADAATGGSFILGKANHETSTASLTNSKGTPLKLSAPGHHAPLSVNQKVMVKNLNAQYVGGLSASALQAAGGDGYTTPTTDTPVLDLTEVASTGPLAAGTYYVTGTALVEVAAGDDEAFCGIVKSSDSTVLQWGGGSVPVSSSAQWLTSAETLAVNVASGGTLQEWCEAFTTTDSFVYNASVTAIRVSSSSGTTPAIVGRAGNARGPGR